MEMTQTDSPTDPPAVLEDSLDDTKIKLFSTFPRTLLQQKGARSAK